MRKFGFTLIELMVAILVIGILLLMLFLGLGKVREAADRSGCTANLRQMVVAVNSYASEHNGRLPGPCWFGAGHRFTDSHTAPGVFRPLTAHLAVSGYLDSWLEPENNMRNVPAAKSAAATRKGYGNEVHYHVNLNVFGYVWSSDSRSEPITIFDHNLDPARTIIIRNRTLSDGTWIHTDRMMVAFLDGSVGSIEEPAWAR